ncbi:kinase-like protein [Auricularia subglabra TFB-10046 SS5]|nr:kinase-like protein [Auricularia subglabra TFB-10046 SS5]
MERKPLLAEHSMGSYSSAEKWPINQYEDGHQTDHADNVFCGAALLSALARLFRFPAAPPREDFVAWDLSPEPLWYPHDITWQMESRVSRPFSISPCSDLFKDENRMHGTVVVRRIRFQEEEEAAKCDDIRTLCNHIFRLRHQHVLPYLGHCDFEGTVCIVSPFVEGGDLEQYVRMHSDCSRKAILSQVASGLSYLHDSGIVHGNLHPRNVLMTEFGTAMLSDFALNGIIPHDGSNTMRPPFGRMRAMHRAPEEHMGAPPSMLGDVYSFGMLVFTVFCDDEPMIDQYPSPIQAAAALMAGWRPDCDEICRDDFSERMWTMVQWCWAHDPQMRPSVRAAYMHGLQEF